MFLFFGFSVSYDEITEDDFWGLNERFRDLLFLIFILFLTCVLGSRWTYVIPEINCGQVVAEYLEGIPLREGPPPLNRNSL